MEIKTLQYGEIDAKEYVPGAEILLEENEEVRNIRFNSDSWSVSTLN